jgi:pilus assembly protein CpaC
MTVWIMAWLMVFSGPAAAGTITAAPASLRAAQRLELAMGKSVVYTSTRGDIGRVSVAKPEIANFVMLSSKQIYITGEAPGATSLTVWDRADKVLDIYDVDVAPDVSRLKRMMHDILPEETGLAVMPSQDSITLSGTVRNSESLKKALTLAEVHAPGKVVNLVTVGGVHQVMLEVRVAEMSKDIANRMGININAITEGNFAYSLLGGLTTIDSTMMDIIGSQYDYFYLQDDDGNAVFPPVSAKSSTFQPREVQRTATVGSDATAVMRYNTNYGQPNNVTWTGVVDALKSNGLAKVLAEPTLVCLDGQKANFNAGGEIPIVTINAFSQSVEYKKYGVMLEFSPTVLASDKINLVMQQEVSDLDWANAVQGYPAFKTRKTSTTIELNDGQSFAIAGMLNHVSEESVQKFPGLGDIPILGSLFKSTAFKNKETELVFIITTHLAKPLDKSAISLPTDKYVPPDDLEFFLNITPDPLAGQAAGPAKTAGASGLDGQFGAAMPAVIQARELTY